MTAWIVLLFLATLAGSCCVGYFVREWSLDRQAERIAVERTVTELRLQRITRGAYLAMLDEVRRAQSTNETDG